MGAELTEKGNTLQDLLSWVYLNSEAIAHEEQNDLSNALLPLYKTKVTAVKPGSCMVGFEVQGTVIAAVVVRVKIEGEFSSNTAEDIAKQTGWLLTLLADENSMSVGDKEAVKALGAEISSMTDKEKQVLTVDTLQDLDRIYGLAAGLQSQNEVIPLADAAPDRQFSASGVQIIGANLAAGEVENVPVTVKMEQVTPTKEQGRSQMELRMSFVVDGVKQDLQAPLIMTLPLPNGMSTDGMTIAHYGEDGTLLETLVAGDEAKNGVYVLNKVAHTVTLRVDSFSNFGFLHAPTPPSDGGNGGVAPKPPVTDNAIEVTVETLVSGASDGEDKVYKMKVTLLEGQHPDGMVPMTKDERKILAPISVYHSGYVYFIPPVEGYYTLVYNPVDFGDIAGHFAERDIRKIVARELFLGIDASTFAPDLTMTRGMLYAVLARLDSAELTLAEGESWHAPYANWAREKAFTSAAADENLEENIGREELVADLYEWVKMREFQLQRGVFRSYTDKGEISDYAREAAQVFGEAGIIEGKDGGYFDPHGYATRGEVAAIFARLIQAVLGR